MKEGVAVITMSKREGAPAAAVGTEAGAAALPFASSAHTEIAASHDTLLAMTFREFSAAAK